MPKHSSTPFDQAALDEFDEKEKLFQMMSKSRSYNRHPTHKALYDALAISLSVDEDDMEKELKQQPSQKKRRCDDQDQDLSADPSKEKKKKMQKESESSKKDKDQSTSSKKGTTLSKPSKPDKSVQVIETVEELDLEEAMDYEEPAVDEVVNTKEHPQGDAGLRTYRSSIELEYHLEQRYLAFSEQLDWINPEGDRCPYDLSKPLPLQGPLSHLTIPIEFFFNNDLEYLTNGNKERKYVALVTKTKAASYNLKFIKDMIPKSRNIAKSLREVFSHMQILAVVRLTIDNQFGYEYLKEIVVKRADLKEYSFKEGDFSILHLNDIKDLFLLYVQQKIHNLTGDEIVHLVNALRIYTRSIVIQMRVEDIQLRVKSYQKKLNITKPQTTCDGISFKEPHTIFHKPRGVFYLNKSKKETD
ncbi:hypothetical protein Tco_0970473 [Tanacetum coccineum]